MARSGPKGFNQPSTPINAFNFVCLSFLNFIFDFLQQENKQTNKQQPIAYALSLATAIRLFSILNFNTFLNIATIGNTEYWYCRNSCIVCMRIYCRRKKILCVLPLKLSKIVVIFRFWAIYTYNSQMVHSDHVIWRVTLQWRTLYL